MKIRSRSPKGFLTVHNYETGADYVACVKGDKCAFQVHNSTFHPRPDSYAYTYREIDTTAKLRATLRAGKFAWPGGYPLYFITSDGAALSFEAVIDNLRSVTHSVRHGQNDGWRVVGCNINYENADLTCEHTGKRIPSAYAEDESEKI